MYCTLYNVLPLYSVYSVYTIQYTPPIDKLYPDCQCTVFRLHNRIEPSAVLFWALGIVLYLRIY